MMRRKWMFALIFVAISNLQGQETVFVNLEQLASLHPAWQLADSINRKPKPAVLSWTPPTLSLTELPFLAPAPQVLQVSEWFEEQKRRWARELESLQKQQQTMARQIYLLLPPLPVLDPVARWKFTVQQREKQASERVRLNLRLSFADMLPPEEKAALELRKKELDAELEPPPAVPQPIFVPIPPTEKFDLTPPSPLTEPQKVLDLISPTPLPTRQTQLVQISGVSDLGLQLLADKAMTTLRSIAFEAAKNFAVAYAKQKGWKITFSFQPNLPDATEEVKRAWQKWLKSLQPKE